jgi:hypothetical protein
MYKFETIKIMQLKTIIPEFKKIIISLQIHSNKIIFSEIHFIELLNIKFFNFHSHSRSNYNF